MSGTMVNTINISYYQVVLFSSLFFLSFFSSLNSFQCLFFWLLVHQISFDREEARLYITWEFWLLLNLVFSCSLLLLTTETLLTTFYLFVFLLQRGFRINNSVKFPEYFNLGKSVWVTSLNLCFFSSFSGCLM